MPPRRSRTSPAPLLVGLLVALAAACAGALAVGVSVESLGVPSPALSAGERLALTAYLVLRGGDLDRPASGGTGTVIVDVEPGETAAQVADRLGANGALEDPRLLTAFLRYRGWDTAIEAGRFVVSGEMTPRQLADHLQQASDSRYTLTVLPGWRREQVAEALAGLDLDFTAGDFLLATQRPPPAWLRAPDGTENLEGLLHPETYRLDPRLTADRVVNLMLDTLDNRIPAEMRAGWAALGLTPYQAITLASIIEREAILPQEQALIASVFLNRLALDIPLQADPTVQFALGWQLDGGWWKAPLTVADLEFDSPFNTYRYGGLPPGPIANPGLDALRSVAEPAATSFLFFRAACDASGAHRFAVTFEEHVANACP